MAQYDYSPKYGLENYSVVSVSIFDDFFKFQFPDPPIWNHIWCQTFHRMDAETLVPVGDGVGCLRRSHIYWKEGTVGLLSYQMQTNS